MARKLRFFCLFTALLAVASSIRPAEAQDAYVLERLVEAVELDGLSNEPAWANVAPLPLIQYEPVFNGALTERTEIRVAYDEEYLYVSGRFYDREPDQIRTNSLYRDRYSGDDVFGIILDTFDDNENALWFSTTPSGIRIDRSVASDAEFSGGGFESVVNESWNTYWDVETVHNDMGWFVELRIPYSSLGFQSVNGRVEMGMIAYRFIARKAERHIFPAIPPNWSLGFVKPSQAHTIVLENIESSKPLYITPYISGGVGQVAELNDAESTFRLNDDYSRDIGLDLKFAFTNNLTLDATINTDFAQVEADDQQVNLTRFSLFFPEKRQFFQERSGIFSFSTGSFDRVFYSRRIGLSDEGPVRILGGGRLVGRLGAWDIGVLNMQTEATSGLPSENFGVVRLRRQVFNEQSYAGTMLTSRVGEDGSYNFVYGLDGVIKLSEREYLTTKWIQSFEDEPYTSPEFDFMESVFGQLKLERRGILGFNFNTAVSYSGRDYNPGIGFVQRRAFTNFTAKAGYGWLSNETSSIRQIAPSVFIDTYFRNRDNSLESLEAKHFWKIDMKSGFSITPEIRVKVEDLEEQLEFPEETNVPRGRYSFATAQVSFDLPEGGFIRGRDYLVSIGSFYDGWRGQLNLEPTWSLSKFVEFTLAYEYSHLRFSDRDQTADVHLIGLKTQIGFNIKISLNAFVQYNTSENIVAANVRFRYNFREGNDFWVVFNQNMNTDRHRQEPSLALTESRTVLIKYTHTFIR